MTKLRVLAVLLAVVFAVAAGSTVVASGKNNPERDGAKVENADARSGAAIGAASRSDDSSKLTREDDRKSKSEDRHEDRGDREDEDGGGGTPAPPRTPTPTPMPTPTATPAPTTAPTPAPTSTPRPTATPVPTPTPTATPAPTATPLPTPTPTPTPLPTPTPTPSINAAALYASTCQACHGANRQGFIGPELTPTSLSGMNDALVASRISNVGSHAGFSSSLSAAQIAALTQFIKYTTP